jgi:chromate transporter
MTVKSPSLQLIFWTFLKIGSTAFGGLMSLIAVVENAVVEQKKWLTHEDVLDGISLATFIPGAISVNVIAYLGYKLRRGWGALVSLVGVTLPAFMAIVGLAIAYFHLGQLPAVNKIFSGFIPATAAIIFSTAWNMSRKEIKGWREAALAIVSLVLTIGVGGAYTTFAIIFGSGWLGWFIFSKKRLNSPQNTLKKRFSLDWKTNVAGVGLLLLCIAFAYLAPSHIFAKYILLNLFVTFAGIGVMLFGGAYVGIPLIQELVVSNHHWLTNQEFAYAIAAGQITPGPIVLSAAFIGYKVSGILGALIATTGIFTPPSLWMIMGAKFLASVKDSPKMEAALHGTRSAVIGTIFAAAWVVGKTAPPDLTSILIFLVSLFALVRLRIGFAWIIPLAGVAGLFWGKG